MSLSKFEMEQMASELRESLQVSVSQALNPFDIEITGVAVVTLGQIKNLSKEVVQYLHDAGSRNWSAMSVPLDADQKNWVVLVNESHEIERQRVSLLEELWHILQGHKLTSIVRIGAGYGRSYESSDEHDAYFLASATLLPESEIRRRVREGKSAEEIASHFGTSKELVEYRIKRLSLWNGYLGRGISLRRSPVV